MNCWYDDPKYTEDKVKEMLQPFADRIETECGVKTSFNSVASWMKPYSSSISFTFMGYPVGFIGFYMNYPTEAVMLSLYSKVTFTDKSSFTKTSMQHKIKIQVTCRRDLHESDFEKYIKWLNVICKQIKTAEAKKKRLEMDTDFE